MIANQSRYKEKICRYYARDTFRDSDEAVTKTDGTIVTRPNPLTNEEETVWKLIFNCPQCKKGLKLAPNTGWSNPFTHLQKCLPTNGESLSAKYENDLLTAGAMNPEGRNIMTMMAPMVDQATKDYHKLLKFVIKNHLPQAIIDCKLFKELVTRPKCTS